MRFQQTIRGSSRCLRLGAALLFLGVSLLAAPAAPADSSGLEYKVKAGYLFNFARFVEWPETAFTNATAPFVIGLVGEDAFGPSLDETLSGRNVNGRSFIIRRFSPKDDPAPCHILFVSRSEKARLAALLQKLRARAVLTVGEVERFGQLGGMINFTLVGGQVRLETNPEAAAAAGLKVSSKLLAASRTVKTEPPP